MENKEDTEVLLSGSSSLSRCLTCIWRCDDDLTIHILRLQSFRAQLPLIHVTLGSTHSSFIHPLILFHFILLSFICWDYDRARNHLQRKQLTGTKRAKNTISMELFISNLLTLSIAIGWLSERFRTAKLAIYLKAFFTLTV